MLIKFNKSYAPLLGIEAPLTIEGITEFQLINNTIDFANPLILIS